MWPNTKQPVKLSDRSIIWAASMTNFVRQFYDKRMWWVLLATLAFHVLAAFLQHSSLAIVPLVLLGVGAFVLTLWRLEWGLALGLFEIFIGGHGHLLDADIAGFSVSIRMVFFLAVMAGWGILFLQRKVKPLWLQHRDLPIALIVLGVAVGALHGFLANSPGDAFDDMNGFLTLFYFLPMISVRWDPERRRFLLMTLFTAGVWISLTTLALVYGFTHLPGEASHLTYTFIRDARLTEVTLLTSGRFIEFLGNAQWYFRIFGQSQLIVVVLELLFLAATVRLWRDESDKVPVFVWLAHVLFCATIIASLSRSFWLGAVAGAGLVTLLVLLSKISILTITKRYLATGVMAALAGVVFALLIALPIPPRPDLSESSFYKPKDDNTRELAVSSRWNLLNPMLKKIIAEPIIGSGFGETVTYISDDPRLRAIDPTGEVTTYRFEWGYHDLWLKMGILGLFGFGWFLVTTLTVTWEAIRRNDNHLWLMIGFSGGLAALYVVHVFSPYLNHPIGLGFLVFLLPFFPWAEVKSAQAEDILEASATPSMSVVRPTAGIAFKR